MGRVPRIKQRKDMISLSSCEGLHAALSSGGVMVAPKGVYIYHKMNQSPDIVDCNMWLCSIMQQINKIR